MRNLRLGQSVGVATALELGLMFSFIPAPGMFSGAAGPVEVTLRVVDDSTGEPIFARAVLTGADGEIVEGTGYETFTGHVVFPEGWRVRVEPGRYSLLVDAGFELASHRSVWDIAASEEKTVALERWVDPGAEGWYSGGDHNHLNRDGSRDKNYGGTSVTMEFAASLLASRGWDFFAVGGGGAWIIDGDGRCDARDDDNRIVQRGPETEAAARAWNQRYGDHCHLWWNNEHVKGRFGHLWLLGRSDGGIPYPYTSRDASAFWSFYDVNWDPWQEDKERPIGPFASSEGPLTPNFDSIRSWRDRGLIAIYAHPTRSWTSSGVHWSNIAAAFPFDLLAGAPVGGLVIMGDHHDHGRDQALWFAALNEGFRVAGIAENDTVFGRARPRVQPHVNYTHVPDMGERFDLSRLAGAMAAGRNFVSSGAFLTIAIGDEHEIGATVRSPPLFVELSIDAHASADPADRIDRLEIIADGEVVERVQAATGKRVYRGACRLATAGSRWVIAKLLCTRRPAAAITNPIYFRAAGEPEAPPPLTGQVTGRVTRDGTGVVADIVVRCWGKEIRVARTGEDGRYDLEDVPVASHLEFSSGGDSVRRTIFLDDPDYRRIHHEIYATRHVGEPQALGGCFPADIFGRLRAMARHIELDAELARNSHKPPAATR